jgi:hypothetical protein
LNWKKSIVDSTKQKNSFEITVRGAKRRKPSRMPSSGPIHALQKGQSQCEGIMAKTFPNLRKEVYIQI